jgi:hypothetical protein
MRRSKFLGALALASVAFVSIGCEEDGDPPTTTPTPPTVTERFSGSLNINGALSFPFGTTAAGIVTAKLTAMGPDNTTIVGLAIGVWNSFANSCSVSTGIFNDNASLNGLSLTGQIAAAGTLCARIYDVGKLTGTITFEIELTHP